MASNPPDWRKLAEKKRELERKAKEQGFESLDDYKWARELKIDDPKLFKQFKEKAVPIIDDLRKKGIPLTTLTRTGVSIGPRYRLLERRIQREKDRPKEKGFSSSRGERELSQILRVIAVNNAILKEHEGMGAGHTLKAAKAALPPAFKGKGPARKRANPFRGNKPKKGESRKKTRLEWLMGALEGPPTVPKLWRTTPRNRRPKKPGTP